jgi:clathrin heavy chain
MAKILPIAFTETLNLTTLGIAPTDIVFKNVSLQSHKYISVREEGKNSVAIVDTASKNILRLPVNVDSAIMNPISKVVALRSGANLQIYNLEMKSKMKATTVDGSVLFWKWLDPKTIAIVTDSSVFHWSMDGDAAPSKIFDRASYDGPVQIINYRASADQKWLLLGGIAASSVGGVVGVLQVYSVDLRASQPTMDAHSACFLSITLEGRDAPSNLFCFTTKGAAGPRLNIIEVGVPKEQAFNRSAPMQYDDKDFPVAMLPDNAHGSVFIITKAGLLFLYEVQSGKCIFGQKASANTMFASIEYDSPEGGILAVDQTGRVSHFFVDEKNIVNYVCNNLNDYDLGIQIAKRYNLPGAENLFKQQFQRLVQSGRMDEAMELAAASPQNILRNIETIQLLKQLDGGKGLLQYFQMLLKKGKLNAIESLELSRLVLAKGGIDHIKGWLKDQKLEASEDLGDLLRNHNVSIALSVYLRANVPEKVIGCFLSLGAQETESDKALEHFRNILAYATRVSFTPDYPILVSQLARVNGDRAKDFALLLIQEGGKLDINQTVDSFMQLGDVKNTTNILLEYLKPRGDLEEDGYLQTRLLEINLMATPQVADAIMESEEYTFTHYDRLKIAQLCERAQLYQRALEHYTDLVDIKRVLTNTSMINPEFLLEYFGRMTPENCLDCLRDLLRYNLAANIRLVVEVAKKWNDYLTPEALISLFEEFKAYNGIFYYLGSFVNFTEDPVVVFKYIESAIKLDQLKEVERVCRDNEHYDAAEVKEYLLQQNLKDPRPLIHVCDRFGYVDELTHYLFNKNMFSFIEAYVQRMNAKATPPVVGALLDLNAGDEQIQKLLTGVRPPVEANEFYEQLVAEVEKRNRLKVLRHFLEARANEGSVEVNIHSGLAKIYVDTNNNATHFLTSNKYYDSAVVGLYCESRDPHLAFIAYKRAWGSCDEQLINVCNKNGFFKDEARYLVERQDLDLWQRVLVEENEFRRQLIDQVVATALPESRQPEEVSTTVKAFMAANLPNELIELLERIILHGPPDGEFQTNRNLQNLLILTAIKADKKRVMDYVKRLNNYDGPDIAKIAISEQYQLYEEAFFIYKKFKKGAEAINVLLENIDSMERSVEFAEAWNQPEVWSILAKAQLLKDMVKEAISSFIKADDATQFLQVIQASRHANTFEELISFLKMARTKVKDAQIDNELIYAFAKTNRLADLEDFLAATNYAKVQDVADLLFNEQLYQAARICYTHVNNNAKLAITLVRLELYAEAVEAARKANNILTWKEVCFACVIAKEFRLAQMCAMNIIVYMDHLVDLVKHYEKHGFFPELINVLEQGINLDRAHQGMYTQLGVLYAKYREDKLMEHIKLFWSRLNIPTLLVACQQNLHWNEAVFLYTHYDQYDNAIDLIIQHSAEAWKHALFKEIILQVSNSEIYYRAIHFYMAEHPLLLNDLLLDLAQKLDHSRVVHIVDRADNLPLIEKYLLHVQRDNLTAVNEAVNGLYIKAENYKGLRESVDAYNNFDQISLAQQLERHDLMEMRRISAHIYKMNKRFEKSIELSKKDELWLDAMETAADSKDQDLAEALVYFFVERGQSECYAASLFTCYELIRPDVALEIAWRHDLMDFAMPYMVQTFREYHDKLNAIVTRMEDKEKEDAKKEEDAKAAKEQAGGVDPTLMGLYNPMNPPMLALAAPTGYGMPPMGGMGGMGGYGGGYGAPMNGYGGGY